MGGDGNDRIEGGSDKDLMYGDNGDPLATFGGNDTLLGQVGDDYIFGEAGDDLVYGDDSLAGTDGGNDFVFGGAGNDAIIGGTGQLNESGEGADILFGGTGDDQLLGSRGPDQLSGGTGTDSLDGGYGDDILFLDFEGIGVTAVDVLSGGIDQDILVVSGKSAFMPDSVDPEQTSFTDNFDDIIELRQLDDNNFEALRRAAVGGTVTESMRFFLDSTTDGNIERLGVYGRGGNDVIYASPDSLYTVRKNLTLDGGVGNDTLTGAEGRDSIVGGEGDDSLQGLAASDVLQGGAGRDYLDGGADSDILYGGDEVSGDGQVDDTILGGEGRDFVYAGSGDDLVLAGDGILGDYILGEGGNDTLIGGDGLDRLDGGTGADVLLGGALGDVLNGEADNDTLVGEFGKDTLAGGDQADDIWVDENNAIRAAIAAAVGISLPPLVPMSELEIEEYEDQLQADGAVLEKLEDITDSLTADLTTQYGFSALEVAFLQLVFTQQGSLADDQWSALKELLLGRGHVTQAEWARLVDVASGGQFGTQNHIRSKVETAYDYALDLIQNQLFESIFSVNTADGGEGGDSIHGGNSPDFINGGDGDDSIFHSAGMDTIFGGNGENDIYWVEGTNQADEITAEALTVNSNFVTRVTVRDRVTTTVLVTGDLDEIDIETIGVHALGGDDTITVNFGNQAVKKVFIDGGAGDDTIDAGGVFDAAQVALQAKATLLGGGGYDTIIGGLSNDWIDGGLSGNSIDGGAGNDTIAGGPGHDTINGGAGNDTINGGHGDDILVGGDGDDAITGNGGIDYLFGSAGNDKLYWSDNDDTFIGQEGTDQLVYITGPQDGQIEFYDRAFNANWSYGVYNYVGLNTSSVEIYNVSTESGYDVPVWKGSQTYGLPFGIFPGNVQKNGVNVPVLEHTLKYQEFTMTQNAFGWRYLGSASNVQDPFRPQTQFQLVPHPQDDVWLFPDGGALPSLTNANVGGEPYYWAGYEWTPPTLNPGQEILVRVFGHVRSLQTNPAVEGSNLQINVVNPSISSVNYTTHFKSPNLQGLGTYLFSHNIPLMAGDRIQFWFDTGYWYVDFDVDLRVAIIDDGRPANSIPSIAPIANQIISPTDSVSFSINASDPDLGPSSPERLWFSLATGNEHGAYVNPLTGEFSWPTENGQAKQPGTYQFAIRVDDRGMDSLSFTRTFEIIVQAPPVPPTQPMNVIIAEGQSVALDAGAWTDPENDPITFAWDINGDGQFNDAIGATPTLTWAQLNAVGVNDQGIYSLTVRATDNRGAVTTAVVGSLTINNGAPNANVFGPTSARVRGEPVTFTLSATDPSPADQVSPFTFRIDWDGNGSIDETVVGLSGTQVTHVFANSATYNVRVTATDKDGGTSPMATHSVNVVNWTLRQDPNDASKTDLIWGGTNSGEAIAFLPSGFMTLYDSTGVYVIPISSTAAIILRPPPFTTTGSFHRVIAYGQGGNDLLMCDPLIVAVELHGGDGDDVLTGGRGADSISGDAGNDIIFGGTLDSDSGDTLDGGSGDDLVVGHYGTDVLRGGPGSDLIIAASVAYGDLAGAVYAIQGEWLSGRPIAERVANLSGTGTGPRNNGDTFLSPGVSVLDDSPTPPAVIDQVFGEADDDWLLYDFGEDLAPDVAAGDVTTNIG